MRDDAETFVKFPRNEGRYYIGLFILMLAATGALALALLKTSTNGGSFFLHFALAPLVAAYALAMLLWSWFGRTELSLGNQLSKKTKLLKTCLGRELWHWNEIHDVWTQNVNAGITDKTQEYRGTLYIKFNADRQEVLSNLTFEEAACLQQAIVNRLQPRGIG